MAIKEKDFIEIEYTGKLKEDGFIFDTTSAEIAKENNLFDEKKIYKPIVICVGEAQILQGLDKELIGKELNKSYTIELEAEKAFGKKNAKLLKLVPTNIFRKQRIEPMPGLQVNVDGMFGIIKTVTGGRTIVDFNHPLSGKDVSYDVKVNKLITDPVQKLKSFITLELGLKDLKVELKEQTATIELNLPEQIKESFEKKLLELVPEVKKLEFSGKKPEKPKNNNERSKYNENTIKRDDGAMDWNSR